MASVILKEGRERSVLRRHPWVFSGAIGRVEGSPASGETVEVSDSKGHILGRGAFSPESQIRVRMWTLDSATPVDAGFFKARIAAAVRSRAAAFEADPAAARRLVNSESDLLPGLIVDRYAGVVVCQFLSAGADRWREAVADALEASCPGCAVYEKSDADEREKEGLTTRVGALRGQEPVQPITVVENGLRFTVDVKGGHKTGFYLDQRENRAMVRSLSQGREVLDCFSYTGGFTLNALTGGAKRVTAIESSGPALRLLESNAAANSIDSKVIEPVEGDVFHVLRSFRDAARSFDLVVLDPPKFAASKGWIEKACRGYKDINLLAMKLLRPGGTLVTFSCSGLVERELFHKIVADAAVDAKRDAQVLRVLGQGDDHPFVATFPEGSYLKGVVCRVL